ncbi:uncharacterized protein EHS24_004505 [Apiotrichum porosum]|uniref:Uncharacterized protein n=1 Tax=Apiotrichum porosum TaxID=105984 RepID=A0A427Y5A8_9TREE|nr:uncharacterized protein EHS24_004505 [Apiotrichum porosum]RSH86267.1 hypothetical protein EHS24_004505 [Apiotrichum porosum]
MIRSNPTAIPLRPSDLKLLQAELDARRAERERDTAAASGSANAANTSTAAASSRHKSNTSISTKTNGANGRAHWNVDLPLHRFNVVELDCGVKRPPTFECRQCVDSLPPGCIDEPMERMCKDCLAVSPSAHSYPRINLNRPSSHTCSVPPSLIPCTHY